MKKTILLAAFIFALVYKPVLAFDSLKCTIDYEFFEKSGENRKTIKLNKDGANYKLVLKENEGKPNEMTTTSYIYLDSGVVYTVSETGAIKMGSKRGLETMYVGMYWGIYFLNFPKAEDFTSITTRAGSEIILSKECMIYDAMVPGGGTRYYFWNDIMLRKVLTVDAAIVVTLQATNINESPVFGPGEFDLPAGVQYF